MNRDCYFYKWSSLLTLQLTSLFTAALKRMLNLNAPVTKGSLNEPSWKVGIECDVCAVEKFNMKYSWPTLY